MVSWMGALALAFWMAAALTGPAAAGTWHKAETDRLVVYGENGPTQVREYAEKLQTFDALLRVYHPSVRNRAPATKLQVVLVSGGGDLRRVQPQLSSTVLGFYSPNNEGVFALVVPAKRFGRDDVLFHEYAHHFMLENFPTAYPAWFVEGFAEYFATVDIQPDRVRVGAYNENRAVWLGAHWLSLEDLLRKRVGDLSAREVGAYYAQAWLLTHYMRSEPGRAKQLDRAITDIAEGKEPVKAFTEATGQTPLQMTRALKAYRRLPVVDFKNLDLPKPAEIKVEAMPASADDFLLDNIRLFFSVTGKTDAVFLASVRRKAERWPADVYAQMSLARAEFVMGDPAAGEAIVSRLLAAHPADKEILLLAGMGELLTGSRKKDERAARYRAARGHFMKVYALDNQDFRPLYAYARTRVVEPNYPSERDIDALIEARRLAPAVRDTSLILGQALMRRNQRKEAEVVLRPLLNDPHGAGYAKMARAILAAEPRSDPDSDAEADGQNDAR